MSSSVLLNVLCNRTRLNLNTVGNTGVGKALWEAIEVVCRGNLHNLSQRLLVSFFCLVTTRAASTSAVLAEELNKRKWCSYEKVKPSITFLTKRFGAPQKRLTRNARAVALMIVCRRRSNIISARLSAKVTVYSERLVLSTCVLPSGFYYSCNVKQIAENNHCQSIVVNGHSTNGKGE